MKQCTKCRALKSENYFHKNINYSDGLEYWCRDCWAQYRKEYRDSNLEDVRQYNNDWRAQRIQWFQELKSNIPCMDCGQIYEPYCMDYDHVPEKGQKINSVSRMVLDNVSKEIILAEIEKCELVCVLCHNRRTHKRFMEELGIERAYKPNVQRNIGMIDAFKSQPCAICGQKYEIFNMQIDHIDPLTKLYDVCQLKSRKVEILLAELAKCQVLCALCHRRQSILDQQNGKYKVPRPKPAKRIPLFVDVEGQTKECSVCHQIKNFSDFSKQQKTKDGLASACKECLSIAKKKKRGTYDPNSLPADQKECSHCNAIKNVSEFSTRTDGGLFSWCKECFNRYRRERRKLNKTASPSGS